MATGVMSTYVSIGQPFIEVTNFPGPWTGTFEWADFDNDGRLDLFATTTIYRNLANGTFAELTGTSLPGVLFADGMVGDCNRDGNVDVLISGQGFPQSAFFGSGTGTFSYLDLGNTGPYRAQSFAWGDYDNDGDLDVSARNYTFSGGSAFFRNLSDGVFTNVGDLLPANFTAASWCDYDQDGFADLLASGDSDSGPIRRLFRSNGATFVDIGVAFAAHGSAAWGDFDNDGDADLLISGSAGNMVYRNDGGNAFTANALGLPSFPVGSAIWGDFDNDGWLDILVAGSSDGSVQRTKLFHNNSGVSFSDTGVLLPGVTYIFGHGVNAMARCADFDNDGDLDLTLSGSTTVPPFPSAPIFKLFRNDIPARNSRPNAPTGLIATVSNLSTVLTLSWNASFDTNQVGGHTYNLRIGTQPGAADVFNTTADNATGFRRIVAPGNSGGRLNRIFTNFPAGIFYWSVQAIDHSYVGSIFAPEASFMVAKPTISDIPDQKAFPGTTNSISFTITAVGTPVDAVTLGAVAADASLIPSDGLAFAGSGTNRILVITPARDGRGTTIVTVTVTDTNGATASDSFVVEVRSFVPSVLFGANMAWGDYNNDGLLDAVVMGSTWGDVFPARLYQSEGNGVYSDGLAGLPILIGSAAWGDYNNDGFLDFVLLGYTGSASFAAIYRNNGDGTFTDIRAVLPQVRGWAAWGDFDNDGDLDLLFNGEAGGPYRLELYRNDHGIFVPVKTDLPAFPSPLKEPWGDYNRDGFLDLLISTNVFRNNGDGTFTDIGASIEGVFGGFTAWGDYDNDGYLDVAVSGIYVSGPNNPATRIYHNNHDDTFTDIGVRLWPSYDLDWGDFDNDGWLDIVVAGRTNVDDSAKAFVYHNNGDGTFSDKPLEFSGSAGANRVDYDGDGALDLVAGYATWTSPWLHHNENPKKNVPPFAPTGLTSLILSNNDVRFVWSPATDFETTNSAGLNYNIRVGTTPGGIDLVSPQADVASGRRRLSQRGNVSTTYTWLLRDLPAGTNYWSVQAIDPGFVGGAFAPEASVVITNERPTISSITTQTVSHSVLSQPIEFAIGDRETLASALVLTANSSNTNRIPNEHIFLSGAGSNRLVQLRPLTNQLGAVTITLMVVDEGGWSRNLSFVVNVTNLPPYVAGLSNINVLPGAPVPVIAFQIGDESPPDELSLLLSSSNTNLVANGNLFLGGSGANRFLQINPTPGIKGISTIKLVVRDSLGAATTNSFVLRVSGFALVASGLPDVQQGAVDWGDFDNDERLDVLICGRLPSGNSITRVYRNNGNGTFTDIGAGLFGISGTSPPTAAWGDFNGDSRLDILIAAGGIARIYRNNGNGGFVDITAGLPASNTGAWCDYDNDGDLDVVLTRNAQPTRLYRNNGNGTFSNSIITLPQSASTAPADFDNDGDVDFALGGVLDNQVFVTALVRNDGNGVFSTNISAGLQGVSAGSWSWNDYDQDGRLDLLMTGINGNFYFTRLYHNDSDGTFDLVATNLPGINAGTGVWGDYDSDGAPDLFLTGISTSQGSRVAKTFHNDGGEVFTDAGELLSGTQWSAAAFADYDNDGKLDLLYCGTTNGLTSGSSTILLRSIGVLSNSLPSAPSALTVLPGAILSWSPGADSQTTTYNLRIGTNSGGTQIISPHANVATGFRRVARIGNVGTSTRWRANLPPGTYYWSVQAIDAAFAGSAFATESSFTIPDRPPVIISATFVAPGQLKLTFEAVPNLSYRVLISSNLVDWAIAGTAAEGSAGQFEFVDSTASTGTRFYRVSSP